MIGLGEHGKGLLAVFESPEQNRRYRWIYVKSQGYEDGHGGTWPTIGNVKP